MVLECITFTNQFSVGNPEVVKSSSWWIFLTFCRLPGKMIQRVSSDLWPLVGGRRRRMKVDRSVCLSSCCQISCLLVWEGFHGDGWHLRSAPCAAPTPAASHLIITGLWSSSSSSLPSSSSSSSSLSSVSSTSPLTIYPALPPLSSIFFFPPQNQKHVYSQVGFHIQGISLVILVHNACKMMKKQILQKSRMININRNLQ